MDIARGSRRARHVAATNAAAATGSPDQERPDRQLRQPAQGQQQRQRLTPDAHRTPDQQHSDAAPPPHPFRLHRGEWSELRLYFGVTMGVGRMDARIGCFKGCGFTHLTSPHISV